MINEENEDKEWQQDEEMSIDAQVNTGERNNHREGAYSREKEDYPQGDVDRTWATHDHGSTLSQHDGKDLMKRTSGCGANGERLDRNSMYGCW